LDGVPEGDEAVVVDGDVAVARTEVGQLEAKGYGVR
jgi:hypothetical protein